MTQPSTIVGLFQSQVASQGAETALLERRGDRWLSTSWSEWNGRSRAVAAALVAEGVTPEHHVGVYAYSRREWVEADIGILMSGAKTVTLYQNLNRETAHFIVNDCQARVVFAEGPLQIETLFEGESLPESIVRVVYFDEVQKRTKAAQESRPSEVKIADVVPASQVDKVVSFSDFMERGQKVLSENPTVLDAPLAAISEQSVAKVVYTSGTTGMPKGARLTNRNLLFVVESVEKGIGLRKTDTTLLFLPLAHVYAQLTYHAALKVGFKTAFARSMLTVMDDAVRVRPHFFTSVPRLFEKIHAGVLRQIEETGGLKAKVFHWATDVGSQVSRALQAGQPIGAGLKMKLKVADRLVFSKLKARLGGRVRFMVSGGAPLPRHLAEFFHAANLLIIEGYGMTENAALSHYNPIDRYKFGTVGFPVPGMEHVIAEDGEILLRGDNVMAGYLGNPELTAEMIDEDGWLHTGDVGVIDEDGYLTITDRKKQIIITSGGKNVPPAPIESALIESPLISQSVVIGNGRKFLAAIITVDRESAEQWAHAEGLVFERYDELTGHPELKARVQEEVSRVNGDLDPFSTIKQFRILPRDFTIDEGELTPSLKLKRNVIEEHFSHVIDDIYPPESGEC